LIFSIFFSGCSKKNPAIVFKDRFVCYELESLECSEEVQVRVHKDDVALFEARKGELKKSIEFYEKQVERFNAVCKEYKDLEKE